MQTSQLPKRKRFFLIASAGVFVLALIAFALMEFGGSGDAKFAPMVYVDKTGGKDTSAEQVAIDGKGNGARVLTESGKKGAMCTHTYTASELAAVQTGLGKLKDGQAKEPATGTDAPIYRVFYSGKWFTVAGDTTDDGLKALVDALFNPIHADCERASK